MSNYQLIDYRNWNQTYDIAAPNIRKFFTPQESRLWDLAFPYQDKRNDHGHIEHVVYFAFKLLDLHPQARRERVIPFAIMHDTGWANLPQEMRDEFDVRKKGARLDIKKIDSPEFRRAHMVQGALLATTLMDQAGYALDDIEQVHAYVLQHDVRKGALDLEDGLGRDADKLWRFSREEWLQKIEPQTNPAVVGDKALTPEYFFHHLIGQISKEGYFFNDASREIARVELENTWREVYPQKAVPQAQ